MYFTIFNDIYQACPLASSDDSNKNTRLAFYILGWKNKGKYSPRKYTFAWVWSNSRNTFATLIVVFRKHAIWMQQKLLLLSKNVDLSVFLCTGMKEIIRCPVRTIRRMAHIFWMLKDAVVWVDVWELVVRNVYSSVVGFSDFLEDNCQKIVVYHLKLTISICSSWHMFSFSEKNRRPFAWKCFVCEQLWLNLDEFPKVTNFTIKIQLYVLYIVCILASLGGRPFQR